MATSEVKNEVAPAEIPPSKGETQAIEVDMQLKDGEREPIGADMETNDKETQSADMDMQTENVGTKPAEVGMQPKNVEARSADVDLQLDNMETQTADSKVQPYNEETKVTDAQNKINNDAQPKTEERQPANSQDCSEEKQPDAGLPLHMPVEGTIETSEGNNEVAPAEMPPNNKETQSTDVNMQTENVGTQPAKVDMRSDNVGAQSVNVDTELKNLETESADSIVQHTDKEAKVVDDQIQTNHEEKQSADAQLKTEETQQADVQAYNEEKQLADGQSNNMETQPADVQPNNGVKQGADAQSNNGEAQPANVHPSSGETQTVDVQPHSEETHPADALPNREETQPADGQSSSEEKQPDIVQPNSEEIQPAETVPNDGETEQVDAQPSNEEIQSADAETQSENVEKEPMDFKSQPDNESADARTLSQYGEAKPVDEQMHPNIGDKQPTDVEMHLADGETQHVNAEMCLNDGETQPADLEMQPLDGNVEFLNEGMQPNNEESRAREMQANSGGLQPHVAEMKASDTEPHSVNEDIQSNKGEPQPADAYLRPDNGELQPVDTDMQLDSGEIPTFGAETQLKNEEFQPFYTEFQQNNGEIQPYNTETHPHDEQLHPYNSEMQLHDGQIQPYEMQTQHGQIQQYDLEPQPQDGQIQPYGLEIQPNKRRKKKSMVWEYFTIETVSPGCRRALCNRCKQSFAYSTGPKVAGTSHLKRHIAKGTCAAPIQNQEGSPYTPSPGLRGTHSVSGTKRRYRSSSSPYVPFDQDRCRHEIAKMIIMHDYPLHMVEHPGFMSFLQNLQPQFDVGSFGTMQGDCIATFLTEKQNVMRLVEGTPGRVCLSLDLWNSNQTVGYVVITGHFIDADWKFNKRILNVVMEPYPEADTVLSHALSVCLSEWSLEGKIFSITYNQQSNKTGFENLRAYLAVKNPHILNGQLLIGNCIGHTLGNMAKDLLGAGQDIVRNIRDSVKYVETSDSHMDKFHDLKRQLQLPSEKRLLLDDQTKWNTTYEMLLAASELKEVFSCLDTTDPDYKKAPSMEVWKQVETVCAYLKLLYDAANVLVNTPNPTPITCFHEVWRIHSELGRAVSSEDPFVVHLTRSMHEQLVKYWKDCGLILAIAVVMDPRFKMKLVEFTFTKLYGEEAPTYVRSVDEGIHELFDEYVALPLPLTPTYAEAHARDDMRTDEHGEMFLSDHGLTDFDMYIMETTSQHMKSEIDQYLEESLLPRVQEIDVLSWWKLNKIKYPTLSKMARDILTTPLCTVTSETIFNTIPNKMDAYRDTLRPVTVEALVCAKDWLQYGSQGVSTTPLKMEL